MAKRMCLLMGSSECIPYFALHANEEFALSIKLTLSQTEFSHFYYGKTNKQTNKKKNTSRSSSTTINLTYCVLALNHVL